MNEFAIRPMRMHLDGVRVVVDEYPPLIGIDDGLWPNVDPAYLARDGDRVHIGADNASATYRVVGRDFAQRMTLCELLEVVPA